MKKCGHCKQVKSKELYHKDTARTDGLYGICKECRQATRVRHRDTTRNRMYKKLYGISLDDYNKMFEKQKGCCNICSKHQSVLEKSLAVDHCHETGKVRGLLCNRCNKGLGIFHDDIELLTAAINYLNSKDCHNKKFDKK